jgi:hypothetical protein
MALDKQAHEELQALPPVRPREGQTLDQAINLRVDAYLMDAATDTRREDVEAFMRASQPARR